MSGILWQEMVRQGMARSRTEADRIVKSGAVKLEHIGFRSFTADHPDLDLPGKTIVRCGKHMFRLVARTTGAGFDQLRGRIEIPVSGLESEDGCIHISRSEVSAP